MDIVKYLFYLTALIFPLGQLTSFTVPVYPEVRVHLLDLLVGLTVVMWFTTTLCSTVVKRGQKTLRKSMNSKIRRSTSLPVSVALFIGISVASLIVNAADYELHQVIIGSLYLVRFANYAGLYFVARHLLKTKFLNRARLGYILVTVGLISAIGGIIQYFLYPNLRNLAYLGWDPHLNRAFGTFLDPQFFGVLLVLTLILLITPKNFYLLSRSASRRRTNKASEQVQVQTKLILTDNNRNVLMVSVITVFIALLLTFSRSSYLALAAGLSATAVFQRKWKKTVLALVVLAALFAFIPKPSGVAGDLFRKTTVSSRIESWQEAVTIWKKKPLLGIGFNMLRYWKVPPLNARRTEFSTHSGAGVDNSFLFVLATTGIVGLFAYLNIWRLILTSFVQQPSNFAAAICITVALFIHAMANNTLFYPWAMWWTWLYFALFTPRDRN